MTKDIATNDPAVPVGLTPAPERTATAASAAATAPAARARPAALPLTADEWRRLRAGDREVFRRVYLAYVSLIHYVAKRCGLTGSDAEDVVQEVFTRLFQRVHEIHSPTRVKAWLVACARNLAIDRRRVASRLTGIEQAGDALESEGGLWAADGAALQHELELRLVGELLTRVAATPGGETLRQFYQEGLSTKEIARRNGEAVSTVTTRLSRLRARFRDELRRHIERLREDAGG